MTTIDGDRLPGTVLLDGATLDRLDAISVATGRTPAEVVALLVAEAPIEKAPAGPSARVLTAAAGRYNCTEGPEEAEGHPADWALFAPGETSWVVTDLDLAGRACCDHHIPVGWVRPAGVPRPTTPATTYVDPDGDTLALVPLEGRPADWAVRITTADPDGELDVFIEDDETLAGIGRSWLGAIEDRRR